ncbi:DUF4145 domain-containing protein [Microbacterium sp. NPDC089188]|uniref:DUF4145 domain-containing protein n=1 Tax=Microbacterium sp. NPDC089188 TaxID=3154971 RepID=UPI0034447807
MVEGLRRCPYCNLQAHMIYVDGSVRWIDDRAHRVEAAFQCAACGRFVIGGSDRMGFQDGIDGFESRLAFVSHSMPQAEMAKILQRGIQYWIPTEPVGKDYPDLPSHISGPADEAHRCQSIGAHRASILMARGVIEAAAKDQGVTKGRLYEKIEALVAKNVLRPLVGEAAHAVRHIANDQAHGDFSVSIVDNEDSAGALALMDEVIDEVYGRSARLSRFLNREAASSD